MSVKEYLRGKKKGFWLSSLMAVASVISVFMLVFWTYAPNVYSAVCTSTGSGVYWSATASWSGCGGVTPTASDSVVIRTGDIVIVDTAAVASSVTISANTTAARGNGLTFNSGSSLTVSGAVTLNIPTNKTTDINVGAGTLSAASIAIPGSDTAGRNATVTVSTGTVNVTGDITFTGTGPAQAQYTSTGASTTNIGGNFTSGGTFAAGTGTINFNGSGAQAMGAYVNYNNVQVNKASGVVSLSSDTAIGGTLAINSGTFDIGAFTTTVTGATTIGGTLRISSAAGTKTFDGMTINSGGVMNFTAAEGITTGGNLTINGTGVITGASGTWTFSKAGGGIISGTSTTTQTIGSATFVTNYSNSLKLAVTGVSTINSSIVVTNTGTYTSTGNLTGTGTFTQGSGGILNLADGSGITNLTASASGNIVNYTGTIAQAIHAGPYQTLDVSGNTNGNVSIAANETANTNLNLGATKLTTGANTMIIGSGANITRTTGWIYGNLQKYIGTGAASSSFPVGDATVYAPVDISFGNVTVAGNIIVSNTHGDHPNIGSSTMLTGKDIDRYWVITNSGVSFDNYNAVFNFVNPGDLDAGVDTNALMVGEYLGGVWTYPTVGVRTSTSTQATGVTDFGSFALSMSNNNAPNAPTLVSPSNGSSTNDNTPTLSANYSDPNNGDTGTTNYRISSSSLADCVNNINVVAFGASAGTTSNNQNTAWTPGSSIGSSGAYYWCAQNNDGVLQSAWTSMGNFILDLVAPVISATAPITNAFINSITTLSAVNYTLSDAIASGSIVMTRTGGTADAGSPHTCTLKDGALNTGVHTALDMSNTTSSCTVAQSLVNGAVYTFTYYATDIAGNPATPVTNTNITFDTTAPTLLGVSASNSNGYYSTGIVIHAQVTFSENVVVTGTPQLTLATGTPATTAVNYTSGSGTNVLTFDYTVAAGNTSPDLDYAATTSLSLNGGTIKDMAGNSDGLTLASPGTAGSLGANKAIVIDTIAPVISGTAPATNAFIKSITTSSAVSYTLSETITSGTIIMTRTGGTADPSSPRTCTLVGTALNSGTHSAFDMSNTTNGCAVAQSLVNGSIYTFTYSAADAASNSATPVSNTNITFDTASPTIIGVSASDANATYGVGSIIHVQTTFSENVVVTGTPQIILSTTTPATTAVNYTSGSGTNVLTFEYMVVSGNASPDLDYATTGSLVLNAGTIKDAATNTANLTLATPGAAGSLGANKDIVIDAVPPIISDATPATNAYINSITASSAVNYTLSEAIASGSIVMTRTGGTADAGSPHACILKGTALNSGAHNNLNLSDTTNSCTIAQSLVSGAIYSFTFSATDSVGNIATPVANTNITFDTAIPTVASVSATNTNGAYGVGSVIHAQVVFSQSVNVTGTPQLTFSTGTPATTTVNYVSGSGTNTLLFDYTVIAGNASPDLDYATVSSLTLNGGTIKDFANNVASLTLATPGAAGSLGANKNIVIDTTAPVISATAPVTNAFINSVTTSSAVNYTLSEAIASGTIVMTRTSGAADASSPHTCALRGTALATGVHTGLDMSNTTNGCAVAQNLVNGTVYTFVYNATDPAGNVATPVTNTNITFDNVAPAVSEVTASNSDGYYSTGTVIHAQVVFTKNVVVTGTPQLTLSTGTPTTTTVNYVSGSGTNTLVFDYTVVTGNTSPDLDYAATNSLSLSGGTIKDVANNTANLTLATPGATNSLAANKAIVIDTTAPVISATAPATNAFINSITTSSAVNYTLSENITSGTIIMTRTGGTADPSSPHTCTLKGTALDSGSHIGFNMSDTTNSCTVAQSLVSGAVYTFSFSAADAASNSAIPVNNTNVTFNNTIPVVTGVSAPEANGSYGAGSIIHVQVSFSQSVIVTGTPQLTLSTGTPATTIVSYSSGSGSNVLVFDYTVVAGNTSPDLDYVATNSLVLNGGTIKDAATNIANLTLPAPGATGSLGANKNIVIDTTAPVISATAPINNAFINSITTSSVVNYTLSENIASGTITMTRTGGAADPSSPHICTLVGTALNSGVHTALDMSNTTNSCAVAQGLTNDSIYTFTFNATDMAGNAATPVSYTNVTFDTSNPTVTSVSASNVNGSYKAGTVIHTQVTFSENVVVTGIPQLTLATGTPATTTVNYTSGSGTNILTFDYTVAAGNTSPDLDYAATTSLALNGGTLKDATNNNANLALPAPGAAESLGANKNIIIDTTAPIISATAPVTNAFINSITSPSAVHYTLSETIASGTIVMTRTSGTADAGSPHTCNLKGAALTSGVHSDLDMSDTVNGCTVAQSLVNGAVYSFTYNATDVATNSAIPVTNANITYDTTAPTVTGVSATNANGAYSVGSVIHVQVSFSKNVFVIGSPELTLSTGTPTTTVAGYVTGTGTNTLIFDYTVEPDNASPDLDYEAINSLVLNSGSIKDIAGNAANLTLASPGTAGSLGANKNIIIDTTAPVITATAPATNAFINSVTSSSTINYTLSEAITSGTIIMTRTSGTSDPDSPHTCTLVGSALNSGVHTGLDMSNTTNGCAVAQNLVNGAIYTFTYSAADAASNSAIPVTNTNITFDTTSPVVTGVSATNANGSYKAGAVFSVQVTFSKNVIVTGTPRLTLSTGTPVTTAVNYTSGSGTNVLTFDYTVAAGNASPDLDYAATNSLALNGGTIKDNANNNANLTLASPSTAGSLGANKNIIIDTTAPVISATAPATNAFINSITSSSAVNYTLSEAIASGTITITRTSGTTDPSSPHTCTLVGNALNAGAHTGLDMSDTVNGCVVAQNLVSGAIYSFTFNATDVANNSAIPVTNTNITFDTTIPAVTGVSASNSNGSYSTGTIIHVQVSFSQNVIVTGTPQLTLNTGTPTTTVVNYTSGSGTNILTFDYTVAAGNTSPDLDYAAINSLALNGGTIKSIAGNNANLTLAIPGTVGSLGANKNIIIDTTAPVISATAPATNAFINSITSSSAVNYTLSENITSGTIIMTRTSGNADAGSPHTCTLVGTALNAGSHTGLDMSNTTNGCSVAQSLVSGTVYTFTFSAADAASNSAIPVVNTNITYDTSSATVTGVSATNANGSYGVGTVIHVQVSFSENVTVTGTPQLTLSTGTPATTTVNYISGSGTNTLTFDYTVVAGNTSPDLDYAATTSLTLNGGTIKNIATNDVILTLPSPGTAGSLGSNKNIVIDTTAPVISATAPATNAFINSITSSSDVNYTLSEAITSGTIIMTRTGGTADPGSPHTCTLKGTALNAGVHTSLDMSNTTNSCTVSQSLVDGAIYTFTFNAADAASNSAIPVSNTNITFDTTAPTISGSGVTASNPNGSYGAGTVIHVQVNFSENVVVTGTPQITLATGTPAVTAVNYTSGSGTNVLTFDYTVAAGNTSPDLDYAAITSLALNGGTIKDNAGNNATLTLTSPGAAGSLGANKNIIIDTTAPVISATSPATNAHINSITTSSAVSYILSEAIASGTITITRTGGTADPSSPHICTLVGTALNSGVHTAFDMSNTTNGCSVAQSLVNGAIYSFTFSGTDPAGNVSIPVTNTNITYDANAPMITNNAPTKISNSTITDTTIRITSSNTISVADVTVDSSTTAGFSNFVCTQTNISTVDCTIIITSSGSLVIKAIDGFGNQSTNTESGYIIDIIAPVISIIAPTKTSTSAITNTVIHVTDETAIFVANITLDAISTPITSSSVCTQTSSKTVDCTISIDASGTLTVHATDSAGNAVTSSESGYVINAPVSATTPTPTPTLLLTPTPTIELTPVPEPTPAPEPAPTPTPSANPPLFDVVSDTVWPNQNLIPLIIISALVGTSATVSAIYTRKVIKRRALESKLKKK